MIEERVALILSPIMMLIGILIKLDSPGPVFYAQERMGLDAKSFMMLKFRSMRPDAESRTGPVWATENDPRRTRFGAFIRRFSIDELPQLINVLIGDMSLVGPRPERPVFVEQFKRSIPRYMDRHKEKAGMTGWTVCPFAPLTIGYRLSPAHRIDVLANFPYVWKIGLFTQLLNVPFLCSATFHAETPENMVERLTERPMDMPRNLLKNIDVVVKMGIRFEKKILRKIEGIYYQAALQQRFTVRFIRMD